MEGADSKDQEELCACHAFECTVRSSRHVGSCDGVDCVSEDFCTLKPEFCPLLDRGLNPGVLPGLSVQDLRNLSRWISHLTTQDEQGFRKEILIRLVQGKAKKPEDPLRAVEATKYIPSGCRNVVTELAFLWLESLLASGPTISWMHGYCLMLLVNPAIKLDSIKKGQYRSIDRRALPWRPFGAPLSRLFDVLHSLLDLNERNEQSFRVADANYNGSGHWMLSSFRMRACLLPREVLDKDSELESATDAWSKWFRDLVASKEN